MVNADEIEQARRQGFLAGMEYALSGLAAGLILREVNDAALYYHRLYAEAVTSGFISLNEQPSLRGPTIEIVDRLRALLTDEPLTR